MTNTFADNAFDVTLTHTVLMHVPYPEKVLQEMIRVTRPNGFVWEDVKFVACQYLRGLADGPPIPPDASPPPQP